jgi:TonB-linked SusC/RagA family outer membrane protein
MIMKKMTLLITMMLLGIFVSAQVTITGKVTDASSGEPLPGVSVSVKDFKSAGALTNEQGVFSLALPEGGKTLIFSFFGMQTKEVEIGGQTEINVGMEAADIVVDDVVITALGITRTERSLGYAVQEVNTENIAAKDPVSVTNSLQGRVSGVQIKTGSGTVGGSTSIVIRGASSLQGSNQPLYVVDGTPISNYNFSNDFEGYDFGNGAQDINPDDVESISILKGAAATTLYGNRGANGVIVITTKSGKRIKGIGIEVNSTTTFDNIYILPNFQNEYGGGYSLTFPTFNYAAASSNGLGPEWTQFNGTPVVESGADESWGPKLDGTPVLHWDSFVPESENYNKAYPFSPNPDNYKKIFDTGLTLSNSVAINGGDAKSAFRLSFTNVHQKGIVPNSKLDKNVIAFKGSTKLNPKIEVFTNVNYIKQETTGRSQFGYSGDGINVPGAMRIWTQRQVDADALRQHYYSNTLGQQVGWNFRALNDGRIWLRWSNNPFWVLNNIYAEDAKDRVYGNIGFKLDIIEGLTFTGTARTDFYSLNMNDRVGSGGITTDYYGESTRSEFENNYEGIFTYSKHLADDWSLTAVAGGNIRYTQYKSSSISTVDGLVIENFFHVSNTVSPNSTSSYFSERQTNSLFGSVSLGYKNFLYLDISGRNDWSSTLPVDNNSYFYPSFSTSFVFSELIKNQQILSLGKLRIGYARVGNDTGPYRLYNSYLPSNFGTTSTFTVSNSRNNPILKNETTAEFEVGLETNFLYGRVGAEFTYFDRKSFDQIIALDISSTSGYSTAFINAGELENKGIELVLRGTPVKSNDFSWDIAFNYSKYENKLNSLYGDLTEYEISSAGSAWVTANVGGAYGTMWVFDTYELDENGNRLVDNGGYYVRSGQPKELGSIMPDFNGGVMNTLSYKGIILSALIDFQKGGLVYSYANRWATASGQTDITVGLNDKGIDKRLDIADGGGMRSEGLNINTGLENEVYLTARNYYRQLRNLPENFVYDASYIKLRELKLGYQLPVSIAQKLKMQSISLSIVARNVALLHSNTPGFDPEQVNTISNTQGYEGGSLPSTRSIGFNINLKF